MKSVTEIAVRGYHIDHFGHVNHGRYIEFLEEARWHYLDVNELIVPIHENGGIHVVAKIVVQYLAPARAGDRLSIETKIASRFSRGFVMQQAIRCEHSDTQVVRAQITNVFLDGNSRPATIRKEMLDAWPDLAGAKKRSSEK